MMFWSSLSTGSRKKVSGKRFWKWYDHIYIKDRTGSNYYQTGKGCLSSSRNQMKHPTKDLDEGQNTSNVWQVEQPERLS